MAARSFTYRINLEGGSVTEDQLLKLGVSFQRMADEVTGASRKMADGLKPVGDGIETLGRQITRGLRDSGIVAAFEELSGTVSGKLQGAFDGAVTSSGALGSALTKLGPIGLAAGAGLGVLIEKIVGLTKFAEIEQAQLRIAAVMKATGDASGVTASQLAGLTDAIAKNSFVTKAEIREAEAALLAFSNVAGDNYIRTLKAADDLTTVFGGNLREWAVKLGQVLEDPATGLDRLRRAHIVLSEAQKETIRHFAEMGDTAQAQTALLDALEQKVGGAAEGEHSGLSGAVDTLSKTWSKFLLDLNTSPSLIAAVKVGLDALTGTIRALDNVLQPVTLQDKIKDVQERIDRASQFSSGVQSGGLLNVTGAPTAPASPVTGLVQEMAGLRREMDAADESELFAHLRAGLDASTAATGRQDDALKVAKKSLADLIGTEREHLAATQKSADAAAIYTATHKAEETVTKALTGLTVEQREALQPLADEYVHLAGKIVQTQQAQRDATKDLTEQDAALKQATKSLTEFVDKTIAKETDPGRKITDEFKKSLGELEGEIAAAKEALDHYHGSGRDQEKLLGDLLAAQSAYNDAKKAEPEIYRIADDAHQKFHDAAYKTLTDLDLEIAATKGGDQALKAFNETKLEATTRAQVYASVLAEERAQTDGLEVAENGLTNAVNRANIAADEAVRRQRALFDAREQAALIGKATQAWDNAFQNAANQIDNTITRSLRDAFDGKKVVDFGQTMKTVLAEIAAQIVNIALIKPAIGQALLSLGLNQTAASFGASPEAVAAAAASGGGGLGGFGSIASGFSLGSSLNTLLGGGGSSLFSGAGALSSSSLFGVPGTVGTVAPEFEISGLATQGSLGSGGNLFSIPGASLGNIAQYGGGLLSIGLGLNSLFGSGPHGTGNTIAGIGQTVGGAVSLAGFPEIGIPIAAVSSLIGSLFPAHPQHPTGQSEGVFGAGGAVTDYLHFSTDHGDSAALDANVKKVVEPLAQNLAKTYGADLSGLSAGVLNNSGTYSFSVRDPTVPIGGNGQPTSFLYGFDPANAQSVSEGLAKVSLTLLQLAPSVSNADLNLARFKITADQTGADIQKDINFALNFKTATDAFLGGQQDVTKTIQAQATAAGSALVKEIQDFKAETDKLGLDTAKAADSTKSLVELMVGIKDAAPPLSAVATGLATMKANLEALEPALVEAGYTVAAAKAEIQKSEAKQLGAAQNAYATDKVSKAYAALGLGDINSLAGIKSDFATNVSDASALGLGNQFASGLFNDQVLQIVKGAAPSVLQAILNTFTGAGADDAYIRAAASSQLLSAGTGLTTAATNLSSAATDLSKIGDFVRTLDVSALSPLGPTGQLNAARALVAADKAGGAAGLANLVGDEQTYLKSAQSYYGPASPEYAAIYAAEKDALTQLAARDPVVNAVTGTTNAVVTTGAAIVTAISNTANDNRGLPASVLGGLNAGQIAALQNVRAPLTAGETSAALAPYGFTSPDQAAALLNSLVHSLPHLAGGSDGFGGGLAVVGERGRELVNLPAGSRVFNAGQTRQLLAPAGGEGGLGPKLDRLITLNEAILFENATLRKINGDQYVELVRLRGAVGNGALQQPANALQAA